MRSRTAAPRRIRTRRASCATPRSSSIRRSSQLDDLIASGQRELRQQLLAQHQQLSDDIRQKIEDVLARLAQRGAGAAQRQDRSQGAGGAADRDGDAAERRSSRARAGRRGACLTSPRRGSDDAAPGPDDAPAATVHRAAVAARRSRTAAAARAADAARGSGRAGARRQPRPASAVELRTNDPHLKRALAPTIEDAITASVRRNPRPLADALFPVIGPAIRKAIAATLQRHDRVAQPHARAQPVVARRCSGGSTRGAPASRSPRSSC